jgi:hypothetical protein
MKSLIERWKTRQHSLTPSGTKAWRYGLLMIIAVYAITTLVQSMLMPVFEGSDEQRHYAYARYLSNHISLPPRTDRIEQLDYHSYKVGQEAGQPPLYYIPVALLTSLASNADDTAPYVIYNPFVINADILGLPFDNHNSYLHGAEGSFPFRGVALADHLGRLVSIAAGACTLLGVYGIASALVPNHPAIGLLATALIAGIPGFIFVHSVISNDVAVITFVTLSIWIAVRIARAGATVPLALLGGLFAGLATLSKVNGIWAIGIVWLAVLASALIHRQERPAWSAIRALLVSCGVWLLVTGWWFAYGVVNGGDPLGVAIHAMYPDLNPLRFTQNPNNTLLDDLTTWDRSMWYAASWPLNASLTWVYTLLNFLYLAGLAGAIGLCAQQMNRMRVQRINWQAIRVTLLQAACVLLAILLAIAGGVYWQLVYGFRIGRLLYPGLTSAAVIAAIGWCWWLRFAGQIRGASLSNTTYLGLGLLAAISLEGASVGSVVFTSQTLLPHAVIPTNAPGIVPTQLTFMDPSDGQTPVAEVVGYRLRAQDIHAGNIVYIDICWRSLGYTRQSFPYSVQLVGPNDVRPGTRNSYHGLGSYPLAAWQPGEAFCDPTSLRVDFTIDRPRAYNLVVTLFDMPAPDFKASPPLSAMDRAGHTVYPNIGRVRVAPDIRTQSTPMVTPTVSFGNVAGLVDTRIDPGASNTLSVTLRWVALGPSATSAKVFMHVVDTATGKIIAQDDHEPDDGWLPTNYWLKGDVIDDHFALTLPAGNSLSNVNLQLGMYDAQTQARLPAVNLMDNKRYIDDSVPVTP